MKKKILILTLVVLSLQIMPIQSVSFWDLTKDTFGKNATSSFRRTFDSNYSEQLTALGAVGVIATGAGLCSLFLRRPKTKRGRVANVLTSLTFSVGGIALTLNTAVARNVIKNVTEVARNLIENTIKEIQK